MATQAQADEILASILQMRAAREVKAVSISQALAAGVTVKEYRRNVSVKPVPDWKWEAFAQHEFEPDNSRIGKQTYGFLTVTDKIAAYALYAGNLDLAARLMVQEYRDIQMGTFTPRLTPMVSLTMLGENDNL